MTIFYITISELRYGGDSENHLRVFTEKDHADKFCDSIPLKFEMVIREQKLECVNDTIYIAVNSRWYSDGIKLFTTHAHALEYTATIKNDNKNLNAYVLEYDIKRNSRMRYYD